jgi:hypothetical protein
MPGHAGIGDAGKEPEFRDGIAVADSAGLDADADMAGAGVGKFTLDDFKSSARGGDLYGTARYRWHGYFSPALWMKNLDGSCMKR